MDFYITVITPNVILRYWIHYMTMFPVFFTNMLQAAFQLITLMEIREENGLLGYLIYPHSVVFSYIFQSSFKFKNNP